MMAAHQPAHPILSSRVLFGLLFATLFFAPIFRASVPALPQMMLQLFAIALAATALWSPGRLRISYREAIALGLLLLLPLLYLVPLPAGVLDVMPGHAPYRATVGLVSATDQAGALSLVAFQTQSSWLVLLIPIAVFLATRALGESQQLKLVTLLLAIAAFQATLALVQFGAAQGGLLLFGFDPSESGSAGTFRNRNHLAGMLEMILPIALALLVYSLGRERGDPKAGWRRRVSFFASIRGHKALVYGALAVLLILGIIFTRSRTGIALAMMGILLTTFLFSRRIGGDNVYGPTGTLVALVAGLAASIGLVPVLDRFSVGGVMEDMRWTIFHASIEGLAAFLPFGSGPGTFPRVFPAFQPLELGPWFIDRVHNDYIEWIFGGGIPVALLILLLLGLYFFQWTRLYSRDRWSRYRFVQVAAGIGLLMMLIHEFLDFNLHIPANMVFFAFLAGLFFSDPGQIEGAAVRRRHQRRTPVLAQGEADGETPAPKPGLGGPSPEQIPNPFLDD
jgi:O-antigen ligase